MKPRWQNVPGMGGEPIRRVLSVRPLKPIQGFALTKQIEGLESHFLWDEKPKGRTVPHLGPGCPFCRNGYAHRFRAYVPWMLARSNELIVVELGAEGARNLQRTLEEIEHLGSFGLSLQRADDQRKNSKVTVIRQRLKEPVILPDAFNVEPSVFQFWGWSPECD